jgi:ADP-L-glycero-D-manno-heptose 6-epimerase
LTRAIFAALHREPRIRYIPMPEDLRGRYQYYTQATVEKLRSAGFALSMWSLEEGVRSYVQENLLHEARAA